MLYLHLGAAVSMRIILILVMRLREQGGKSRLLEKNSFLIQSIDIGRGIYIHLVATEYLFRIDFASKTNRPRDAFFL